jgi:O-antigen/teichoic acid export membrane protein
MKKKLNKERIWLIALVVAALFFLVMGIVKIVEAAYLTAGTSLITTLVFSWIALKIIKGKINFEQPNDGLSLFLPVGFMFTVIGGSGYLNAGVWGFGLTLFVIGLLFSPKHTDAIEKEENAG